MERRRPGCQGSVLYNLVGSLSLGSAAIYGSAIYVSGRVYALYSVVFIDVAPALYLPIYIL